MLTQVQKSAYLTASFKALPGLNAGTLLAAISISLPVCGLRPLRAARLRTETDQLNFVALLQVILN